MIFQPFARQETARLTMGQALIKFLGAQYTEYDGEVHTAANLFDALKEGYYGKL